MEQAHRGAVIHLLRKRIEEFSHLLFPFNCYGCGTALTDQEKHICEECIANMPLTKYWLQEENTVEKMFWGKIKLVRACSYLFFTKGGMVQSMMHNLKYRGKTEVGHFLGAAFGSTLEGPYSDIDIIVPVPLHASRQKKRGYNQCDPIVQGMAEAMGKESSGSVMKRLFANESQTRKGRYERWLNVKELFSVADPEAIAGKHVLVVDDVITTGSTLEATAGALLTVPGTRVSIASIACPAPV